jgi:hypothetical protein
MPASKQPDRKLSAASLRKLARAHTEVALQVLAEVATTGNSEASRISAAMALLDRGYGKSGTGLAGDSGARAPTLYQRIELVDGTEENSDEDHQAADSQD